MFNEKRILLFLNHGERASFKGKRMAYAGPEKLEGAPAESKETLKPAEKTEVLNDLMKNEYKTEWDAAKDPIQNLQEFADGIYGDNKGKAAYAKKLLQESLKWEDATTFAADKAKLSKEKCTMVNLKNGSMKFYKTDSFKPENEIKLSTLNAVIRTPKESVVSPPPVVEKKESDEGTDQQKSALEFFKKAFPGAKPDQIRISGTESLGVGTKADLNLRGYFGGAEMKNADPDYYGEDGSGRFLSGDNIVDDQGYRTHYIPAEIQQGFVVEAPKKNGVMGKFVLAKLTKNEIGSGKTDIMGWVEIGNLRNKGYKHEAFDKVQNVWSKKPEFTDEVVVVARKSNTLGNTVLYNDKGTMIRMIGKGEEVITANNMVRKVGNEEYINVSFEKSGAKDTGWIRKDMVLEPAPAEVKPPEVAYKEVKDERSDETMVAKYYNRETGKVHFDGDRAAEQTITISDLFPGAKKGDKIRVKRNGAGKSMEASFDPDKTYTKFLKNKTETRKGTFVYGNGVRVEIYDGDVVLPRWETGKSAEGPKDRAFLEKVTLKAGDTYESIADRALSMDPIMKAFEKSKYKSVDERRAAYVKLLKQFQDGNTLFLVVPTPSEAGVPTANEVAEVRYGERAESYADKFRKNREASEKAFRGNMKQYLDNQVMLDKSLLDVVDGNLKMKFATGEGFMGLVDIFNDKEAWLKLWNGEGSVEIAGLDQLIAVLKHPIFVEAGITPENARVKIIELIRVGRNDRVDFEDVLDSFKIYTNKKGQTGDLGDFKNELEENSKLMKANEGGYKAFEAKKGQGILKQTQIVNVVTEKRKLAESQGDDPAKYKSFADYVWHLVDGNKQQFDDYFKAVKALDDLKGDPEYQQWGNYREAANRIGYLNYVLEESGQLLQAIGQLKVKEFKAAAASPEKMAPETGKSVAAIEDVFRDSDKPNWRKNHPDGRSFSWEDVVAGTKEKDEDTTVYGKYFDEKAPMLRIRSRLNRFGEKDQPLDGVERISETDTVNEFNRLMKKALQRLISWKTNPAAATEFINKYTDSNKVQLPPKNKGETDEAYAVRVTPMLSSSLDSAFQTLKLGSLSQLQLEKDSPAPLVQKVQDQKDLIKIGYYFDSRDEEKGLTESTETKEAQLSMNPMIRKVQEIAIAKGYPKENAKKIESVFIGGIGLKIDTTKPLSQAFGAGLGSGVDLGDGFVLMVGIGVDSSGPVLGVAVRKGIKLGAEKDKELGITGGVGVGLTGPSIVGGVDYSFPISDSLDMKMFAGGSVGILVSGVGVGIGIGKNYETAQKNLEKQIGGMDTKEIDAEKDPDKKYLMIINNPQIGPYFRSAAQEFENEKDQKSVVLDLYETWRANVSGEAVRQNSAPFISGGGVFAGMLLIGGLPVPYVGPYLSFTIGKDTYVYRRQSESSKEMDKISQEKAQARSMDDLKKKYPDSNLAVKETKAAESGNIGTMANGDKGIRLKNFEVDLAPFKDEPSIDKYNEALRPYDMKLVPDAATGLLEFQVFGALGNLQILMDPGMEHKGLILKDGKVFLAPGAKPELFITREEFFTPFPKKGSPMNTIVTISDTPKRTRSMIQSEVAEQGSYLYRKAGMQWEVISTPNVSNNNVMDAAGYAKYKGNFETFNEKVEGFDETKWKEYEAKVKALPFIMEAEPDLTDEKRTQLKKFSKDFFNFNVGKYGEYTTVKPGDTEAVINEKRRNLAALIQTEAQKDAPPKGRGMGAKLSDLQMNFVMSELMDVSFMELEKAPDKRARFEQNLEWSKQAVLLPFFRKKIADLNAKGLNIKSTPEQLVDLVSRRLLEDVKDEELGKPGQPLGPNWMFSSVAGAIGLGLRGVAGYITQDKYGVLGLHEEDLSKPGLEGDLAKVILELESPLDTQNDKAFAESIMAKKLIAMPGMWFVLGDANANQALDGMQKALKGEAVGDNAGFQEFKKIAQGIRDTQLRGGNAFIYNAPNGNSFEFRLNTKVADMAHARCGNASFAVAEDIQIFARMAKETGLIVAGASTSTGTVSPETTARFISFGLAGVVTIETGAQEAPPPPPGNKNNQPVGGPGGSTKVGGGTDTGGGKGGTVPPKVGGGNPPPPGGTNNPDQSG